MTATRNDIILVLASWYPSKLDAFEGDFIQRTVKAISRYNRQYVIYVIKDKAGTVTNNFKIEKTESKNLTEVVVYYKAPATGFRLLDKILSHKKYLKVYKLAIKGFIKENGLPKLAHVHVALKAGLLALYLKRKFKIPYFVSEHWSGYFKEVLPNIYSENRMLRKMAKKILLQSELLITVSDNLGMVINQNFVHKPYKIIRNVVATELFFYNSIQKTSRFRFIHPSGMGDIKNPKGILAAAKIVKDRGYDFELLMIGAKDEALISFAKELCIYESAVTIKAAVPYGEVAVEMQQSNALVMFSFYETLSCVLLEALCCGLPVICSNVGGMPEVISENNGLLVESDNIIQLADAMCRMMDSYQSYNRNNIWDCSQNLFNDEIIAQNHNTLYKTILPTF